MSYKVPSIKAINECAGSTGLTCISTFSGCGGSSTGYKAAGFDVRVASEFVPEAADSYELNAPKTKVIRDDVREVSGATLLKMAGLKKGELDLLDGSPPCSSFSTSGLRDKAWGEEKQYSGNIHQRTDDLFFQYTRLIDEMHPKVFIAENVVGLVAGTAKGYFKEIWNALSKAGPGYVLEARKIEGRYLGIPQNRQRLIIIGVRKDLAKKPIFPKPMGFSVRLDEALADLPAPYPALNDFYNTPVADREYEYLREGTRTRFAWDRADPFKLQGSFKAVYIEHFNKPSRFNWFRCRPDEPCQTVTAKVPCLFRWDVPRTFSIAELRRISSFPDDFRLSGNFKQQWERIGRAVPPMMMGQIANTIAKEIFGSTTRTEIDQFIEDVTDGR